jgi:hypothetical protein
MHGRIRNVLEGMHVAQRQTQSSWLPGAAAVTDSSLPSSDDCVVCSHRPVIWTVGFIPIFVLVFGQVELRVRQLPLRRVAVPALWPDASSFRFAGLDDMRASVIESEIADRTRGLRFCNSIDSTRASFTAAIRPATTATVHKTYQMIQPQRAERGSNPCRGIAACPRNAMGKGASCRRNVKAQAGW